MSSSMRTEPSLLQKRQETLDRIKQTLDTEAAARKPVLASNEAKKAPKQHWEEFEKEMANAEKQYTTAPSAENLKLWEEVVTEADTYNHKKLNDNHFKAKNVLRINQIKAQLEKINAHKKPPSMQTTPVPLAHQPATLTQQPAVTVVAAPPVSADQKAAELEMEQQLATLNKAEKHGNKRFLADVVIDKAIMSDEHLIDLITDVTAQEAAHNKTTHPKPDQTKIVQIQQATDDVTQTLQNKVTTAVTTATPDITALEKQAEEMKKQGAIFTPKKHFKTPHTEQTSTTTKSGAANNSEKNASLLAKSSGYTQASGCYR
jgi:hypothetical protein